VKRLLFILAFLLLTPAGGSAQNVKDLTLKSFGIYHGETVTTPSGGVSRQSRLLRETDVIGKDDWKNRFGITYMLTGDPGAHAVCKEMVFRNGAPSANVRTYRETNADYDVLLQYNPAYDKRDLTIVVDCEGRKVSKTFTLK